MTETVNEVPQLGAPGRALERELQANLFNSADAQEGIAAFVEKRKPDFKGR